MVLFLSIEIKFHSHPFILLLLLICFTASFSTDFEWSYPACWETSRLKSQISLKSTSSQKLYDKLIVIGDIHGNWNGLMEVLDHAGLVVPHQCEWTNISESVLLVQTGKHIVV